VVIQNSERSCRANIEERKEPTVAIGFFQLRLPFAVHGALEILPGLVIMSGVCDGITELL
jgi:hypothetical protein